MNAASAHGSRVGLILGLETTLFVISFILWTLRIDTRWRILHNLWWDDFFITLAVIVSMGSYVSAVLGVANGLGQHIWLLTVPQITTFLKLNMAGKLLWAWEVTFVKLSIAFMFLRFSRGVRSTRAWEVFIYCAMSVVLIIALVATGIHLSECTPFAKNFHPGLPGHCRSIESVRRGIIGATTFFTATDFLFALLPLSFIFSLKRTLREKIALACIMGLGIIASVVGVTRFIGFNNIFTSADLTWNIGRFQLISSMEASLGTIAANIPPLKARSVKWFETVSNTITSKKGSVGDTAARGDSTNPTALNSFLQSKESKERKEGKANGHGESDYSSTELVWPSKSFSKEAGVPPHQTIPDLV